MANQKVDYEINRGGTTIKFPHAGEYLQAIHPFYGPNTAKALRDAIHADATLREPTASETLSFLDTLYGGEHPISQETKRLMRLKYFRGFTGIAYDKANDLISCVDFPQFNQNDALNKDDLLARIAEREAGIRTATLSRTQFGSQTPSELSKNPFVIALLGEDGADKAARLADKHPGKEAYVFAPNVTQEPVVRIAALYSDDDGHRLCVVGDGGELDAYGFAFAVLTRK